MAGTEKEKTNKSNSRNVLTDGKNAVWIMLVIVHNKHANNKVTLTQVFFPLCWRKMSIASALEHKNAN